MGNLVAMNDFTQATLASVIAIACVLITCLALTSAWAGKATRRQDASTILRQLLEFLSQLRG